MILDKGQSQRRIFYGGYKLEDFEQKALDQFKEYIQSKNLPIHEL
jgi:hypothetical protein